MIIDFRKNIIVFEKNRIDFKHFWAQERFLQSGTVSSCFPGHSGSLTGTVSR